MVETRTVRYPADGLTMVGHLAIPDGPGRKPGVLVGHEGPGLNDFQRRRADQLAERGYLALAFDYNGGRWFTEPDEMMARSTIHTPNWAPTNGYCPASDITSGTRSAPGGTC